MQPHVHVYTGSYTCQGTRDETICPAGFSALALPVLRRPPYLASHVSAGTVLPTLPAAFEPSHLGLRFNSRVRAGLYRDFISALHSGFLRGLRSMRLRLLACSHICVHASLITPAHMLTHCCALPTTPHALLTLILRWGSQTQQAGSHCWPCLGQVLLCLGRLSL